MTSESTSPIRPRVSDELIGTVSRAPDYIEFITFNDWGESTYLGPVRSNRNAPQQTIDTDKYVSGHNHTAFLVLSAAYTQWRVFRG